MNYIVREWVLQGYHYEYGSEHGFPNHDEAYAEMKRLLAMGVMCDTIRRY